MMYVVAGISILCLVCVAVGGYLHYRYGSKVKAAWSDLSE